MYTKSMLTLGGVLVGAGMFWMRKRYLYEKTRQELKVKYGLQSNSVAHSNIDNNIPEMMDTREQDILYRPSTSADQTHNIDSDVLETTEGFMQCPSVEKPKGFFPSLDEITLTERERRMINREIQKPTINPLFLLNRIIPGIRYEHEMIYNPPAIRVEAMIFGRPFCACGPTKKAAKLLISYMAMYYFFGYEQQDLMYKPSTSAAEPKVDHIIPTTNTREDDTLYRPSTSTDQKNLNNGIPTTNRRRGRYFIGKKIFYREQDNLYRPSTLDTQTHIVNDIPATAFEIGQENSCCPCTSTHQSNVDHGIPTTNTRRKYFIEKKQFYREKNISYRPSTSVDQTHIVNHKPPTTNTSTIRGQDILYRPSTSADQTHNIDSDVPETTEEELREKEIEYLQAVFKRTGVVYIP